LAATLCGDPRLSAVQFRVFVALLLYFHNTGTGKCVPSYRQLADASWTSTTTAKRTTGKLKAMGVIDFAPNQGGRSRRNSYILKTVSLPDPLASQKGARGGPFKNGKGITGGRQTVSPADPHIPNEESNKGGGKPATDLDGHSQPRFEIETGKKLSPEEIKRRDQMVRNVKAQFAKTAERMTRRRRSDAKTPTENLS
jgi:hypothetical protein